MAMSGFFDIRAVTVAFEEKRAWAMAVIAVVGYAAYVVLVLSRANGRPLAEAPYVGPALWTIGLGIANVLYLCFVLSALLCATTKIIAYRRGLR